MASFLNTFGRAIHYWGCVPELRHARIATDPLLSPAPAFHAYLYHPLEGLHVGSWMGHDLQFSEYKLDVCLRM